MLGHIIMPVATYQRGYTGAEKKRLEEFFERSNPSPLLFLNDFDWCKRTKAKFPDRMVIFREGHKDEENPFVYGDAKQVFNRLLRFTENNIIPYVWNEPNGYDRDTLSKTRDIGIEVCRLFREQNITALMVNWSVGNPGENLYSVIRDLLKAIIDYNQILGLHEYGTYRGMEWSGGDHTSDVVPYRVGRYQWILDYCERFLGGSPYVFVSEFGMDSSNYPKDIQSYRGYKDTRSAAQYANELIKCWENRYNHPKVLGGTVFTIGNTGNRGSAQDWRTHDVFNDDSGAINEGYLMVMENWYSDSKPAPIPIPTPNPNPIPDNRKTLEQAIEALKRGWNNVT